MYIAIPRPTNGEPERVAILRELAILQCRINNLSGYATTITDRQLIEAAHENLEATRQHLLHTKLPS